VTTSLEHLEKAVIGACITSAETLGAARARLKSKHFRNPHTRALWNVLRDWPQDQKIERVLLGSKLELIPEFDPDRDTPAAAGVIAECTSKGSMIDDPAHYLNLLIEREQRDESGRLNGAGRRHADPKPVSWRDHVVSAAELRTKPFQAIRYVVPGVIPEGVTILAGRPKIGKSWLALDIALSVAGGRFVLGDIKPTQGSVLYCALEDNPRRLSSRIKRVLGSRETEWPSALTLATQWRRLDAGGVADVRDWADTVENPRLVILDTLAGVRPERSAKESVYDGDYRALRELHDWAGDTSIAALVLHHTRKLDADDPLDMISGSLGLAGCADTSIILGRSSSGTTLYIRGRDIEERELAIRFAGETCRWTVLGEAAEVHRSDSRARVLAALSDAVAGEMNVEEIRVAIGQSRDASDKLCQRMAADGELVRVKRGVYRRADHPDGRN
jgi:hypothetical protein